MKVLIGYVVATLIGFTASQNLLSLLQNPSRRIQLRRNGGFGVTRLFERNNYGIHDADHVSIVPQTHSSAHASASSSAGIAVGGLGGGTRLIDLILGAGLHAGPVGQRTVPQVAVRRASPVVRQRPRQTFVLGQDLHSLPRGVALSPAQIQQTGLPAGIRGTTMLFDTPDPNTPDVPDLVYAPRSIMGDMQQIEALRNRAEADGVVFV